MVKPGRKPMDVAGQRFGKLTVEKYVPNTKKGSYWLCSCDCGNNVVVSLGNLKKGNTKSCGCLSKKENLTGNGHGENVTSFRPLLRGDAGEQMSCAENNSDV